jgi:septum site-determining protein MinD
MLAIAGGKGGCGKTTTALGLARALGRAGRTVLVADADRDMPNLHALAGVPNSPSLADLTATAEPSDIAHPDPAATGVGILPAGGGDDSDAMQSLRHLSDCKRRVLLDCPAGAGPDAAAPLRIADCAALVSLATPQSLRDAAKTAAMARALDTSVVAAAVVRTDAVRDSIGELLGTETVVAVPDGGDDPLRSSAAATAYRRLSVRIGLDAD